MWWRDRERKPREWTEQRPREPEEVPYVVNDYSGQMLLWVGVGLVFLWALVTKEKFRDE